MNTEYSIQEVAKILKTTQKAVAALLRVEILKALK